MMQVITSYDKLEQITSNECSSEGKEDYDLKNDFLCKECAKSFCCRGNLNKHIKEIQERIKVAECKDCKNKYSTKGNLKLHVKSVHNRI